MMLVCERFSYKRLQLRYQYSIYFAFPNVLSIKIWRGDGRHVPRHNGFGHLRHIWKVIVGNIFIDDINSRVYIKP